MFTLCSVHCPLFSHCVNLSTVSDTQCFTFTVCDVLLSFRVTASCTALYVVQDLQLTRGELDAAWERAAELAGFCKFGEATGSE